MEISDANENLPAQAKKELERKFSDFNFCFDTSLSHWALPESISDSGKTNQTGELDQLVILAKFSFTTTLHNPNKLRFLFSFAI